MTTPTPERALELAKEFEIPEDERDLYCEDEAKKVEDCAAILRHYAEILPKWQAVLDAEPVAYFNTKWKMAAEADALYKQYGCKDISSSPAYQSGELVQLIIKPEES